MGALFSDFALVGAILLRTHQRFERQLRHEALYLLVIDTMAHLPQCSRDAAIAIAPMVTGKDRLDLLFQLLILIRRLRNFLLIVEGAARQVSKLE